MASEKMLHYKFSAWFPIVLSYIAFLYLICYVAFFGIVQARTSDEGLAARIFQLLIAGQIPFIAFFIFKYFSENKRGVIKILVTQVVTMLLVVGCVFVFEM